MKKYIFTFVVCLFVHSIYAQTDGISYQAVIIDNNPQEIPGVDIPSNNLPNTPLDVQFSIIDNSIAVEYQEIHRTTTDAFGMINLMIGQGTPSIGAFNQIYWNNDKFLKVEIDLHDGNGLVEFSYQELTYIPYVKHREIIATSTLDVDGETNLNNNLTVNNQAPTLLTGDLTVLGLVNFDGNLDVGGDLTVGGDTNLEGDLNVVGQANFSDGNFENITVSQNSSLNTVTASGVTTINNSFFANGLSYLNNGMYTDVFANITGTLSVSDRSDFGGQVWINANRDSYGGDLNSAAYPLRVSGSKQGIEIELTGNAAGDTPNNSNNFVSFSSDTIRYGRIEGQTTSELTNSFVFVWYATQASLETAFQIAMVAVDIFGFDDGDAAIVEGVEMVDVIANWTGVNTYNLANVGVSFSSGFGDYAEWLGKRRVDESFSYGDIVGVVGGKIAKNTQQADHYMVISQNPIVLGNMQKEIDEKNFEKVAFMGQVPVKVIGKVNIGDYIIPSGLNDGIGKAISPKELQISDFGKVVGVAWSASENKGLSLINLAVGINTNDTNHMLQKQQQEIEVLKNQLNQVTTYLQSKDSSFSAQEIQGVQEVNSSTSKIQTSVSKAEEYTNSKGAKSSQEVSNFSLQPTKPLSNPSKYQNILKLLEENPQTLDDILADARELLDAKGINYKQFEQTNLLVTDRNYFLNYLRELVK